jgi:hypothetical protein
MIQQRTLRLSIQCRKHHKSPPKSLVKGSGRKIARATVTQEKVTQSLSLSMIILDHPILNTDKIIHWWTISTVSGAKSTISPSHRLRVLFQGNQTKIWLKLRLIN